MTGNHIMIPRGAPRQCIRRGALGTHYLTCPILLAPASEEAMKIANRAFARFKDSFYYWKKYDIPRPVMTRSGLRAPDIAQKIM